MFLKAKNWSTRVTRHEEDNGEVLGPLPGDQGQVGDVGEHLSGFMDFALSTIVCSVPDVQT